MSDARLRRVQKEIRGDLRRAVFSSGAEQYWDES